LDRLQAMATFHLELPSPRRQTDPHRGEGGSGVLPARKASSPCRLDRFEPERSSGNSSRRTSSTETFASRSGT
jgi:hypothetical protein